MTVRRAAFVALDTTAAGAMEMHDAFIQTTLIHNVNELVANKVQPAFNLSFEVADPFNAGGYDYPASSKTWRVNAPPGAWCYLVEPRLCYVPPEFKQVEITIRLKADADVTIYALAVTSAAGIPAGLSRTSTGVQTITGTGTTQYFPASPSTWRVDVDPRFGGLVEIAIICQTVRLNIGSFSGVDMIGTVGTFTADGFVDNAGDDMGRPRSDLNEAFYEDWWVGIFERHALLKSYTFDASVPSYADNTAALATSGAGTVRPFPYGPGSGQPTSAAASDRFYLGYSTGKFCGVLMTIDTIAGWSFATTNPRWEYRTTAGADAALTELTFQIVNWNEAGKTGTVLVLWEAPTDWAATDPNSDGGTGFYVWSRLREVPSFAGTEPLVDTVLPLTPRIPFVGVVGGNLRTSKYLRFKVPQDGARVAEGSDIYVVGRAEFAQIYSECGMPVQPPEITG